MYNGIIEARRNNFKLVKVIEYNNNAIKSLSNKLEGYYTVTRHLLERISSNLVEHQISSVEDNCGSCEIRVDKLDKIIGLLETNIHHYFKFNKHEALR